MTGTRAFLALTGGEKVEQDYDEVTKKREQKRAKKDIKAEGTNTRPNF